MLATLHQAARAAVTPRTSATQPENLSGTALRLYNAMRDAGRTVGRARGYVETVSVVHFFVPGEVAADACAMARSTMYRKLEELRAADLVEARAHYVTHRGRTKTDGMVWAVKMDPEQPGRVSVPLDYLKASYRCLSADLESGRTAYAQVKSDKSDSQENPSKQVDINKILDWALPPSTTENPVTGLTVRSARPDLEAVLDVPYVDKADRRAAVDGAARALSMTLGDSGGLMFYRWLIWQLLRLSERTGGDYWHFVHEQASRARADAVEGFARRPGALFVSRLKGAPWWDELKRCPAHRVGTRQS